MPNRKREQRERVDLKMEHPEVEIEEMCVLFGVATEMRAASDCPTRSTYVARWENGEKHRPLVR